MFRAIVLLSVLGSFVCPFASAQKRIPPGFYVEQVTENPHLEKRPRINNRGQLVFMARLGETRQTQEIFLYDNGELIQLTDDDIQDVGPDINDDGLIVWTRGLGPEGPFGEPTLEIVLYRDGKLTRLTDNDAYDVAPSINNAGHIVWQRDMDPGCDSWFRDIYMYDGRQVLAITRDANEKRVEHQSANINDGGQIVWTRYNNCVDPWESQIMFYSDGKIRKISPDGMDQPQVPVINNRSLAAWTFDYNESSSALALWRDGVTRMLTDWGSTPRLNDRGEIFFSRWHEDRGWWQAWLYRHGEFWQLSDDPFSNIAGDINASGEAAWAAGRVLEWDIRYLKRFPFGDLDCDGSIDLTDVEPFILALIDPDEYPKRYSDCDLMLGDINGDGSVDLVDVEPFIDLLIP